MTCSYCQLGGHRRADGCPLATKDMKTLGLTEAALPPTRQCSYCNVVGHLDGACPVLSVHARFQKIPSTYRMPSGQHLPRSPASASKSARACGYCLSIKHDEQQCRWLAISVQRGTLRPDYAFMNPPRFLTDGIKSEEPPAPPSTSQPPKTKKPKRKKMTKQEGHSSTSKNCQANDPNEKKRRKVS
ncbi:hypothetical protein SPRG_20186 [Saprolegnia parasitica CBS 223.65]|uniref:CCHC-type domain-containing protein n=1 Tax=Saprolegnia parasitica (strain CBS 223.65) TaxID=695850 RepID=A0A067CFR8_SAPPC|nr:hypothetical protein SPRG_20186 [Saprolegnia parasitica CBS 223.65]KDO28025.1 hypothetical protein SPRG_20186 [Saprolegnia parasitica CBS 223.65]|eukprot:XP_012201180.1 hypothetical protein SPRG_20186 [Saprolegnia parasitica CBS 223.65]